MSSVRPDLLLSLMRAAHGVAERINHAIASDDASLRPAHGLALVRISRPGATLTEVASFLGVTKQSAAVIIEHLDRGGYVAKRPHPEDARAQVITLTASGTTLTRRATRAAAAEWRRVEAEIGRDAMTSLVTALDVLGRDALPRPVW